MDTRIILALAAAVGCLGGARPLHAQVQHRVQPIILTASQASYQNPATIASQHVPLPCGDRTYLLPEDRDPAPGTAARLMPLPTVQEWRSYENNATVLAGYPATVTAVPPSPTTVRALRPTIVVPAAPQVPAGYVVGKGLIGQPKLYKPGQPVRNFLRFLTF